MKYDFDMSELTGAGSVASQKRRENDEQLKPLVPEGIPPEIFRKAEEQFISALRDFLARVSENYSEAIPGVRVYDIRTELK